MCLVVSSCEIYFSPLFLLAPAHGPVWIYVPSCLGTAEGWGCQTPNLIVPAVPSLVLSWEGFYCGLLFCLFLSWKCLVVKEGI